MAKISWTKIVETVGKNSIAAAYVAHNVLNEHWTFTQACDNENLYGDREDIVAMRERAKRAIAKFDATMPTEYKAGQK